MNLLLQLNPRDNVAVALQALSAGQEIDGFKLLNNVPMGHKVALQAIQTGQPVLKYGYPIGRASEEIKAGAHVHSHNLQSALEEEKAAHLKIDNGKAKPPQESKTGVTFLGYQRPDGTVGIRNEIWIINTVACVNFPAEKIATVSRQKYGQFDSGIDGIFSFSHPYGCSQLGDDLGHTRSLLASLARHPNAAGVLVMGLGCENNQLKAFLEEVGSFDPRRIKFFNAQDVPDEIETGLQLIDDLAAYAATFQREPVPASKLVLGMKCGGSDGLSGITANPLVGRVSDWLSAQGGSALLSEVPEMFGAEQVLSERTTSAKVATRFDSLIANFKDYFRKHHEPVNENPSPGNKDGGITTLEEKSLGCVQKGGTAPVCEIFDYGQRISASLGGLGLVNAPGNDGVSTSAMAAAGAHMILFTTGRGTPLGAPVPTLKIASNSSLAERKPLWIDFDAGPLLTGTTMDDLTRHLVDLVLQTASGTTPARNETNGYREIAIWKDGVTL